MNRVENDLEVVGSSRFLLRRWKPGLVSLLQQASGPANQGKGSWNSGVEGVTDSGWSTHSDKGIRRTNEVLRR